MSFFIFGQQEVLPETPPRPAGAGEGREGVPLTPLGPHEVGGVTGRLDPATARGARGGVDGRTVAQYAKHIVLPGPLLASCFSSKNARGR
jgi:hypothetical protein